jgi:hypothetical protein
MRVLSIPAWLYPCLAVEERRMLLTKALHGHGFAHAGVAVDRDARHAGRARILQQQVENAQTCPARAY